jgi:hypothetical protein
MDICIESLRLQIDDDIILKGQTHSGVRQSEIIKDSNHIRPNALNSSDDELPNCVSIKSTSICNPYNYLQIDLTMLSKVYGVKLDVAMWEQIVMEITSGSETQRDAWKNWGQCLKYDGAAIQYFRSVVCLTDIFQYSAKCNDKESSELCYYICDKYELAALKIINHKESCPDNYGDYSSNTYDIINQRRGSIKQSATTCKDIIGHLNPKTNCLKGIESDSKSCGFAMNLKMVNEYCQSHPKEVCCKSRILLLNLESKFKDLQVDSQISNSNSNLNYVDSQISSSHLFTAPQYVLLGCLAFVLSLFIIGILFLVWGKYKGNRDFNRESFAQLKQQKIQIQSKNQPLSNIIQDEESLLNAKHLLTRRPTEIEKLSNQPLNVVWDPERPLKQGDLLCVKWAYAKTVDDEIDLNVGDRIEYIQAHDCDWADVKVF